MFRFEHTTYFYLLGVLPLLLGLFVLARHWRKQAIRKFGDWPVMQRLMPAYSSVRPVVKATILLLICIFLILGLANPQMGNKMETVKREGVEIVIALDVSNSMSAEDIKPNRLEQAKLAISQLIKRLRNDKLGLVVFAGQAYVQIPLTTDYSASRMFLSSVNTNMVPVQGTAIGAAIELSMESFDENTKGNKALVIISDGENHEDDAIELAKTAQESGIQVHTIGIGSPDGVPIPVYNRYGQKDFRRDNEGNVVITKLNETMMQQIAAAGGGTFVRATNVTAALKLIFDKINELEKEEFETAKVADYESWFQIPLAVALFLLVLEFLILPRKNKWLSRVDIFKVKV
ncbi:MAG: VWA domain-containing protein [Bacteroidota bacterium]